MTEIIRKRSQLNITTRPILKKQAQTLAESGLFTSVSDVVTMALTEFFNNHPEFKKIVHNPYINCLINPILRHFHLQSFL